jgi:hypothetical protein
MNALFESVKAYLKGLFAARKWQYRVEVLPFDRVLFANALNALAADGWQVVTFVDASARTLQTGSLPQGWTVLLKKAK